MINIDTSFLEVRIEDNLAYFTVVYAALIGKLKEYSRVNIFLAWSVKFIGTFFHEMAHFLVSLVLVGKPVWFSIIPSSSIENGKKYYTLGYVTSNNVRWWNVFFISMAPFLLMPLSFWIYGHFFEYFERNLATYFLYIYVVVSLVFSSIPSGVDFKNLSNNKFVFNIYPLYLLAIYLFLEGDFIKGVFHV